HSPAKIIRRKPNTLHLSQRGFQTGHPVLPLLDPSASLRPRPMSRGMRVAHNAARPLATRTTKARDPTAELMGIVALCQRPGHCFVCGLEPFVCVPQLPADLFYISH